ncbi:uncharacterized protein LOC129244841 [Anastrepha obliqua]|uniref:uncharacterized protein LOC129244841 n=1 Tax=Anastrepha obliqua TaxID=95512 RepID=UPI002409156E|nr:uncharacterized protein LOC129244841 [Anastrepha obliqua]
MAESKKDDAGAGCVKSSNSTKSKATNPFFIFLHEFRQNLTKRGAIKYMTAKQIACAAGERWRQMSANEKLTYVVWARKNQQQLDPQLRVSAPKSQYGSKSKRKGKRSKKVSMQKRRPSYIK